MVSLSYFDLSIFCLRRNRLHILVHLKANGVPDREYLWESLFLFNLSMVFQRFNDKAPAFDSSYTDCFLTLPMAIGWMISGGVGSNILIFISILLKCYQRMP